MNTVANLLLLSMLSAPWAPCAAAGEPTTPVSPVQDRGRIKPILPNGVKLLDNFEGSYLFADFNGDGQKDLAVVVERSHTKKDATGAGKRVLLLFLADASGLLKDFATGENVIMKAEEGNPFPDAFGSLDQDDEGNLRINHQGGGMSSRWHQAQTFRCLNGAFFLTKNVFATDDQTVETDFQTGETTTTVADPPSVKHAHRHPKPLVAITEADPHSFQD